MAQVRVGEARFGQNGATQIGSIELGFQQRRATQVGLAEVGAGQIGAVELRLAQVGRGHLHFDQSAAREIDVAQVDARHLRLGQVGATQLGRLQVDSRLARVQQRRLVEESHHLPPPFPVQITQNGQRVGTSGAGHLVVGVGLAQVAAQQQVGQPVKVAVDHQSLFTHLGHVELDATPGAGQPQRRADE